MDLLVYFIDVFFTLLNLAILARVLLSWFRVSPYHPLVDFLYRVTEPILAPLRRVIPPIGMVDISPVIALILLQIIQQVLVAILRGF
ncbi:MAG: YggT family protein [Chloroflexi bacterium]|nr:MAG: YggT family protein [Chloroflexota bacterium]